MLVVQILRKIEPEKGFLTVASDPSSIGAFSLSNIGVAIMGKNNLSCLQGADFTVGSLATVIPLIFSFGKNCFKRKNVLFLSYVEKNLLLIFAHFILSFNSKFVGYLYYQYFFYFSFFNIFLTCLPSYYICKND